MRRPPLVKRSPVDAASQRPRYGIASTAIAVVFGLLFAYVLFSAISNVVGVTTQINDYNTARVNVDMARVPIPWVWLVIDLLLAPVFFGLALWAGRRRGLVERFVIFLLAFAAVSAAALTVIALA
jgi:hypothetical protein